jgi:hypothetical protein
MDQALIDGVTFRACLRVSPQLDAERCAEVRRQIVTLFAKEMASEEETEEQVWIVRELADVRDVITVDNHIGNIGWNQDTWELHIEAIDGLGDPEAQALLLRLIRGETTIFGRGIASEWAYYGALSDPEVASIAVHLHAVGAWHARHPVEGFLEDFHQDLSGWFTTAAQRGKGLFLFAQ